MARLFLLLILLVLNSEEKDDQCELDISKDLRGHIFLQDGCPCWNNINNTCGLIQPGQYICKDEYMLYHHRTIGLGILVGLMLVLLVVVIIGWAFTCWLVHKTTEFSIKPKRRIIQNQYTDSQAALQSTNTTSFQSSTTYSLYEPGYDNPSKKEGDLSVDDQEGIYEVLDGDNEKPSTKRVTGRERRVILSGGESESYNKLKFENLS